MIILLAIFIGSGILAECLTCQVLDFGRLLDLTFECCSFALKEQEHSHKECSYFQIHPCDA